MRTEVLIPIIVGIISCIIGVATFVGGLINRAKQDGQVLSKLDYACEGIEKIKLHMEKQDDRIGELRETLIKQESRILNLEEWRDHVGSI